MDKNLPDKWIRKAVIDAIGTLTINGNTIKCYDYRVKGKTVPSHYILLTSQSSEVDKNNKCEYFWESELLIDIVTSYPSTGNTASRLLADSILDMVNQSLIGLQLDVASGLKIINISKSFPSDLNLTTNTEVIFRKFLRLRLVIA